MRKVLALVFSLLMVFTLIPMAVASADSEAVEYLFNPKNFEGAGSYSAEGSTTDNYWFTNSQNAGTYTLYSKALDNGGKLLPAGTYKVSLFARWNNSGRDTFDLTIRQGSKTVKSFTNLTHSGSYSSSKEVDLGEDNIIKTASDVPARFSLAINKHNNQGQIYLQKIVFTPVEEEPDYNVNLTMSEGASIRLDLVNGLRFTTSVDTDKVAELEAAGATVEYGTLIMPADLVTAEELTLETNVGGVTPIDVVYKADALVNGNQFRGSIVGVKETNIARDFVGRGYVKVTAEDGTETVSYAAAQTRSLKEVAAAFAAAGYPGVDDAEVKALVDTWANK